MTAGKDGVHAENSDNGTLGFVYIASGTIKIQAEGDGVDAGAYVQIEGGTIDVLAGGGSKNGTKESSDSWGSFMGGGKPVISFSSPTSDDSSTSMKGIKAADSIQISNGDITINSADDAIHSNVSVILSGGTFEIASGDDAIHADETLTVTSGKINITESYEGLEALNIGIQGGDINLVAGDDGLNAAGGTDASGTTGGRDGMFGGRGVMGGGTVSSSGGSLDISGGNIYINASGDGIDSNGTLNISGGYIVVSGPTQGDTSILDYDVSGVITGGTFIGMGSTSMAQNFSSSSTQGCIMVNVSGSAGTSIKLADSSGNILISHEAELGFSCVIISHASISEGETYTITVGSSNTTITMDSTVYGSSNSGGMGGRFK